ncbi:hypothetical protein C534_21608 [Pseudomonas aeruginosa P49]|nr:hypothetical protein C533_21073 [Pseudomonas aeruginosa P47]OPF32300.1 hypothetical protein C532_20462 [Pseudomonas aeruginosa P37]OPF35466.1 hypothetical protein C531_19590 [Pseudomonas aeruginosa SD9]OPF46023.1 hypothetical protein C534_21608 [Pseudomonas aeruginosa P49]
MCALVHSITDFTPGLPFLFGNLDAIIDPDGQPAFFGTNHFDALLELSRPTPRYRLNQICQLVLTKSKLLMQLLTPIIG